MIRKLLKNIGYMFAGNFGSKILSVLLVPLYTSVLSTSDYGICDIVFTSVALLLPIFTLTIYESMLRFSLDKQYDLQSIFTVGMKVSISGFGVLMLLSSCLLLINTLKPYYFISIAYYFFYMLYECMMYFLRGIGQVKLYSLCGLCNTILMLTQNLLYLLVFRLGVQGYLLAHTISCLVTAIIALFAGRLYRYFAWHKRSDIHIMREMLWYSIPLIPNMISWWISNSSDRYILTAFCGAAVNGIYSVAYKIPTIINTTSSVFNAAWQLSAVEDFGSKRSIDFFSVGYSRYLSLLTVTASIVIATSKLLAKLLYKADFYAAWEIVPILTLAVVFSGLGGFVGTIFTAHKNTKSIMYTTMLGAGVNIVLNLILIPQLKSIGAAVATLLSYVVIFVVRLINANKILRIYQNWTRNIISFILLALQAVSIIILPAYGEVVACILTLPIIGLHISLFTAALRYLKKMRQS